MKNFKLLFSIILLGSLLFPLISLAGTYTATDEGGVSHTAEYQGLVPCGKEVCVNGEYDENGACGGDEKFIRCQFCHFFVMVNEIINFVLLRLVPFIAVLMLVIGGVMFMFAYFGGAEILPGGGAGGPKTLSQAKRLITSVIIGLIIIFAAWLLIGTFLAAIGLADWSQDLYKTWWSGGFFQINCPIQLE